MRIIGGEQKGRRIKVSRRGIRPTKGIVREAIFNVIGQRIHDAVVLDVFAGSGAIGIEAILRGAKRCIFIEKKSKTLLENIKNFSLKDRTEVINNDFRSALKSIKNKRFGLIFLDPPYNKGYVEKAIKMIDENNLLGDDGTLIAEHRPEESFVLPGGMIILKKRCYGETVLTFIIKMNKH